MTPDADESLCSPDSVRQNSMGLVDGSGLRLLRHIEDAELVAVEVAEIGPIEPEGIVPPKPGITLVGAPEADRRRVDRVDGGAIGCLQCDHRAIAYGCAAPIYWCEDAK